MYEKVKFSNGVEDYYYSSDLHKVNSYCSEHGLNSKNQKDFEKAYSELRKQNKIAYKEGGKTTFKQKATAIAKNFEGKKVEPKYQKEYGKTYDKAEAKEVGNKIAGSQKAKYDSKMSGGGKTKRGGAMQLAKQIRKEGESWQSALKRANEQVRNKWRENNNENEELRKAREQAEKITNKSNKIKDDLQSKLHLEKMKKDNQIKILNMIRLHEMTKLLID